MLAGLPSEELVAGEGLDTQIRRIRIGDDHVLVARLTTGEVVAFSPVCPHQFTELDEATIRDGNLRCPRHGYSYETGHGENVHPARDTRPENLWKVRPGYLPCYPVREEGGTIWVSDQALPPPDSYDPALEERPVRAAVDEESQPAPAAGTPVAAVQQSVKFLSVASESTVEIRLPIIPRPGFEWQFAVTGELLYVVDQQLEPRHSPCHLVRVAARGAGAATLSCTYASAQGEPAEVRTFIVRIQPS